MNNRFLSVKPGVPVSKYRKKSHCKKTLCIVNYLKPQKSQIMVVKHVTVSNVLTMTLLLFVTCESQYGKPQIFRISREYKQEEKYATRQRSL